MHKINSIFTPMNNRQRRLVRIFSQLDRKVLFISSRLQKNFLLLILSLLNSIVHQQDFCFEMDLKNLNENSKQEWINYMASSDLTLNISLKLKKIRQKYMSQHLTLHKIF